MLPIPEHGTDTFINRGFKAFQVKRAGAAFPFPAAAVAIKGKLERVLR